MMHRPFLQLEIVDRLFSAGRAAAQRWGARVSLCVVDSGGHIVRLERLDGAPLVSLRVAEGKARTALEMQMDTATVQRIAESLPSITAIVGIYPFAGGFPLVHDATCIGAVGVSGDTPENDVAIAQQMVEALH